MRTRLFYFSLFGAIFAIVYVISPVESFPARAYAHPVAGATPTPTPARSATPPGQGDGVGAGTPGVGPGIGGRVIPFDPANPIYRQSEVDVKARILSKPVPDYPAEGSANCASGTIRLAGVFGADGSVKNIRPLNNLPYGLTDAAVSAARRIQFEPAERNGTRVSQYFVVEYNFDLYYEEGSEGLKTPAIITDRPAPVYPEAARKNGTRGKVVLRLMLMANGQVRISATEKGLPDGLTEAAIEAAKWIKFTPAVTKAGCLVAQSYRIEYSFEP